MWLWLMLGRVGLENSPRPASLSGHSLALASIGRGMQGSSPRSFPAPETNVPGFAVDQPL